MWGLKYCGNNSLRNEGQEEKKLGKMESCLNEFTHVVKEESIGIVKTMSFCKKKIIWN